MADKKELFFISTEGKDVWSGTLADPAADGTDGPFATFEKARDTIREILKKNPKQNIQVQVRKGTYSIKRILAFGIEDAPAEGHHVVYEAYPGEKPVLSAGVPIRDWRPLGKERPEALRTAARAKVWVAEVPEGLSDFKVLFDGNTRLPRARSEGFIPTGEPLSWSFLYEQDVEPFWSFGFPEGAVKEWDNLETGDVELVIRGNCPFTMNILPLESVDEKEQTARTAVPGGYPLRALNPRYTRSGEKTAWIENVLEALSGPGEWVLDSKAGKLYLWPPGDDPGDAICAPGLLELIRVEGEVEIEGPEDRPARGLVFRGLTFTQADRGTVTTDDVAIQHDWEMIDKGDALVRFRGAEDCAVVDCRFTNSGGSAVRLDLHSQRIQISGNEINHLGGAGVLLIGYGPGTKDVNKNNEIVNNHVHHCGEIYWHAHGIVVWQSGNNRVAHNCIHHMPRKAIALTGVRPWFFDPTRATVRECSGSIRWHEIADPEAAKERGKQVGWYNDPWAEQWPEILPYLHTRGNVVEYNHIYRVGEILGDGATINITGAGEQNVIRGNFLHDIYNPHLAAAIRTDEYQNDTLIEKNVIFRCNIPGVRLKHANYVVNNVFADLRPGAYMSLGGRGPLKGSRITKNIFYHPGPETEFFITPNTGISQNYVEALERTEETDKNIYFAATAEGQGEVLAKLQAVGCDPNSKWVDPGFKDWETGNFKPTPRSPAEQMGIEEVAPEKAGLTKDFTW